MSVCNDESVDEQSLWVRALGVCGERRESRASAVRALWVWTLELSSRTSEILPSVMVEESAGMWISLTSARAATLRAATRATRAGARARPLPANADFCCERTLVGAAALVMVAIVGRVVKLRFPVGTREVTPPGIGGTTGRVR